MTKSLRLVLLLFTGWWCASLQTSAVTNDAYTVQAGGWSSNGSPWMVGYDFTPATDISVTALGIIDWYADGLVSASQIGIWNSAGALLASATLPAGRTNPRPAGVAGVEFYYTNIVPVTLTGGGTYRIGNQQTGGHTEIASWAGSYAPAPDIAFGLGWANSGSAFARPRAVSNPTPYMGPAFQYELATGSNTLSLSQPKTRLIVQRTPDGRADIHLRGYWSGTAAQLQARAVVMPGSTNSGTSTDWVVIATAPTNGLFAGVLPAVAAGGWYQIEVRALDARSNVLASVTVAKVGVGDIFVTAGQSNAACYGSPAQTPGDDRVSAYSVAGNAWVWAADPQPNPSGGAGTGGSPWPTLGTLLAWSNAVPVGLVAVAWGGTTVEQWQPGGQEYLNLKNALQAFGPNGVRAVLWHQGESDSQISTTAASYAQQLGNVVAQSRADAGWSVPWGIAEVSYNPSATRPQEEAVAAGERLFTYGTTNCFRGPRTDDFNLEGEVSDGIHFNAAGLSDHARQWADALNGVENLTPVNGDFESNIALPDGLANYSIRVIGWNLLDSTGAAMAIGANGYFNPGPTTYSLAADTNNGGVLPNMSGRHAGTLLSSIANQAFLQTLRAHLQPATTYTLSVALGVRDKGGTFGGYRLDLLANGAPLGTGLTGSVATLDALAGGSASGKFTVASYTYKSGLGIATNQQLAIRITKPGGSGTYLDFDNVQMSSQTNRPPTAGDFALGAVSGAPATVPIIGGLVFPADPDGDALTVTAVSSPTTSGGTATTDGTNVTYTSANAYTGGDSFTYTVTDGRGGFATAIVSVTVAAAGDGFNRLGLNPLGNGEVELRYMGISGLSYALEWTHSLAPTIVWTPVLTNQAGVDGFLSFTNTPSGEADFYRTRYAP